MVEIADCPLKPAEIEIIELASRGLGVKQIAGRVGKSYCSVQNSIKSAREKLGLFTVAGVVGTAFRNRWIS